MYDEFTHSSLAEGEVPGWPHIVHPSAPGGPEALRSRSSGSELSHLQKHPGEERQILCVSAAVQPWPALCQPLDRSPPGPSARETFQQGYWSGVPSDPLVWVPQRGSKAEDVKEDVKDPLRVLPGYSREAWETERSYCSCFTNKVSHTQERANEFARIPKLNSSPGRNLNLNLTLFPALPGCRFPPRCTEVCLRKEKIYSLSQPSTFLYGLFLLRRSKKSKYSELGIRV